MEQSPLANVAPGLNQFDKAHASHGLVSFANRLRRLVLPLLLSLGMLLAVFFYLRLGGYPLVARAASRPVRYVAPAPMGSDSGNDCSNVYKPGATVQRAGNQADANDEIRVASGTYAEPVNLNKSLTVRGGFTTTNWVTPDPDGNPTIIDAQGSGRVIYVPGGVVATVSGFHLTGGSSGTDGAGVYNGGTLVLEDSYIYDNRTFGDGGGVHNASAAADLILRNSRVYSNTAVLLGGGFSIESGTALIEATEVFSNSTVSGGGGIYVAGGALTVRSSLIYSNTAVGDAGGGANGGGVFVQAGNVKLENNTIYDNEARFLLFGGSGGGIYAYSGTLAITNCLIISNTAIISGGGIYSGTIGSGLSVVYTDFFANSVNHIEDAGGPIDPTTFGSNNRVTDPLFVAPQNYDLHLSAGSPAINSGTDASDVTVDFEGNGRPFDSVMDRGADEYTGPGTCYARPEHGPVYTSVQAAVDAADDGDVVQVAGYCSGVGVREGLTQTVYISRSLTLRGGYTVTNWTSPIYGPTVLDAQQLGRVIYVTSTTGINVVIENLHITNGYSDYGAGVYLDYNVNATLQNNAIYDNEATMVGGGVSNHGSALLQHNTIYSNTGMLLGGGIRAKAGTMDVRNTLVISNQGGGILVSGGSYAFAYNDFYGNTPWNYQGAITGATDISADPGFVDPVAGDFHLTLTSAAVNAADPASTLAFDFDGEGRPQGTRSDIGADESRWYTGVDLSDGANSPLVVTDLEQIRGKAITFTHVITNIGSTSAPTDTFAITVANSDGWDVTVGVSSPVVLTTGASLTFDVVISVPVTVADPVFNQTTITATSETNATGFDTALDIIARPGVELAPSYTENADPGEVVTYTHTLTNVGPTDTFTITFSSSLGWGQLITPTGSITLDHGETAPIVARVCVTDTAPANLTDITLIRATSSFSVGIFAVVTDTTIANPTTGDRFVATSGDNTDNNCTQQDHPCATIGYALNQAAWGDTIFVAQGTYDEADIYINQNVSLRGGYIFDGNGFSLPGGGIDPATTVIDVQGSGRGLRVQVASAYHPVVEGFTIRNAAASGFGGAIYVQASSAPTLTQLIILDSSATRGGGIYVDAGSPILQDITISSTVASDRGGGIYVSGGSSVIQDVVIFDAAADSGGGIYVAGGNPTVQRVRVLDNVAGGYGGGVCHEGGTLNLWNSFIYGNTATTGSGGGVYKGYGTLNLLNNTLYGNQAATFGGGIFDTGDGSSAISNTIVATNTATTGGGIYRASGGGSSSIDYNDLWGNTAASFPDSNVSAGPHSISVDPLFVDMTIGDFHLAYDSPCVDTADPDTFLTTDIDGDIRPSNQGFDIGADELAGCLARIERTGDVYGVLQDAIDDAVSSDVIQISGTCQGVKPRLVNGQTISQTAFISMNLTLAGGYASDFSSFTDPLTTTLDAQGMGRALVITGPVSVRVSNLTLTGGDATGLGGGPGGDDAGGGLYSYNSDLFLEEGMVIASNHAACGGGLYSFAGTLTMDSGGEKGRSYAVNNTATYGGGFYLDGGSPTIYYVSLGENAATQGGGIYNAAGSTTISQTHLYSNTANAGGGIYSAAGLLSAEVISAAHNSAVTGGGLYNANGAHLSLQRSVILSNTVANDGGGFYNAASGVLTLTNTIVAGNAADTGDGGGLYNLSPQLTVRHDTFYANSAGDQGGGIYHDTSSPLPVINSTLIVSNTASAGGGIYSGSADPNFDYNDVYGNTGGDYGGNLLPTDGTGNISADPDFISTDPASNDFLRIPGGSPAEDTADPNSPIRVDIEEDPRPSNHGFDIGADEVGGCYVRINGQPPTYGNIQVAVGDSSDGDKLHVAGTCAGVNVAVDGGQVVSQTVFLTKSLTVQGGYTLTNWADPDPSVYTTTLDALGLGRVLYVADSITVTIDGLHLCGGTAADGGAVFVKDSVLTMTSNLVYSNTATNGGALYNQSGVVNFIGNEVFNNTADYGGAAYGAGGETTLGSNDLRGNQATADGGAYYHAGGSAVLQNNIVRDNQATDGGGVYNGISDLTVRHNMLYANVATNYGGGFYTTNGDPSLVSNIFLENEASVGHAIYSAVPYTPDYNDAYPSANAYGGGVSAGSNSLSVDPLLVDAPGGDFHLQDDSPVMDAGDPAMTLFYDFEGDYRPGDQGFDMGADERKSCWAMIVRTGVIYGSPQRAIDSSIPGDVIQVSLGECRGVHPYDDGGQVVSQTIHITHSVTLWGGFERDFSSGGDSGPQTYPDPTATTINPMGLGRALLVTEGVTVTLRRFILINGDADGLGGGPGGGDAGGLFYYRGDGAILEHVDFYSSTAAYGGALFSAGDDFNMYNSWINYNTAITDGGAIYNASGAITITVDEYNEATRIYSNVAGDRGGGIYNDSGNVLVLDNNVNLDPWGGQLRFNQADQGGFLYNNSGQVRLENNTIFENDAKDGGAIYNNTGTAILESNEIYDNSASNGGLGRGGGFFNSSGAATLNVGNRFYGNDSDGYGGAIYSSGVLTAWNTLIYTNTARDQGAGIYAAGSDVSILHNTFYENAATAPTSHGGAIYIGSGISPTIKNNIFDSNTAYQGSAIYGSNGILGYNDYWPGDVGSQVAGGVSVGSNNLNADPAFENGASADFHLTASSAALIDVAEADLGVSNDFEGDPRPINVGPDIGADEYDECLALLVRTGVVYGRIQEALDNSVSGDTIRVAEGTCYENVTIDDEITISGSWEKDFSDQVKDAEGDVVLSTFIDALSDGRVVTVNAPSDSIHISCVMLWDGNVTGNGGGVWSAASDLRLSDVIVGFSDAANGGGVYIESGTTTLDDVFIYANTASADGGGVYVNAGVDAELWGGGLWGNQALGGDGGGLYNDSGSDVYVTGGTPIYANTAGGNGGGVYNHGATLTIYNKDVEGNQAANGGGIYVGSGSNVEFTNLLLYNNTATTGDGGGLYRDSAGSASLYHNTVYQNDAAGSGGGIYNAGSAMSLNASIVASNVASTGSGVYGSGSGSVAIDYTLRWNNSYGGSVSVSNEVVADPRFKNSSGDQLSYDSPAIDAVPMSASNVEGDQGNDPRQYGQFTLPGYSWICAKDMGVDEYIVKPKLWTGEPTPADATLLPTESITYTFAISNSSENWSHINACHPINYGPGTGFTETITVTLGSDYPSWSRIVAVEGDAVNLVMLDNRTALFDLRPAGMVDVQVRVTVPEGTFAGLRDETRVQYEAQLWERPGLVGPCSNNGFISGVSGPAATLVDEHRDFLIAPDNFGAALPGQTLTYTHVITNRGNITDTYDIIPKAGFYASEVVVAQPGSGQVTLTPYQTATVVLNVTIRSDVAGGLTDVSSAIARSNREPPLEKAAANNTTISDTVGTRYVSLDGNDSLNNPDAPGLKDNNCTQPGDGVCRTIQHAINQAAGGDLIKIDQGVYTDVITITYKSQVISQTAFVNKSVTLQGGYDKSDWEESPPNHISQTTTLDPQGLGRALYIAEGIAVTVDRLAIRNGDAEGQGGGPGGEDAGGSIYNEGANLTLNANRIYDSAADLGGGLYHGGGDLLLQNNLLHSNSAGTDGGAVYAYSGTVTLQNDTFHDNQAIGNGGAVYVAGGSLAVTNTIFANNTSSGGAMHGTPATASLDYDLYYNNAISDTGGTVPAPSAPHDVMADPRFVAPGDTPPDLYLQQSSPAREAGDPATDTGQLPWDYGNNPRLLGHWVDIGAYEYVPEPRVELEPDHARYVSQGTTIMYTHTLTNAGDLEDTFDLTLSSTYPSWVTLLTSSPITLSSGLTATVEVSVTVPSVGVGGLVDVTIVTATSRMGGVGVFDTVVNTTTVEMNPGLEFEPDRTGNADPDTVITYTHVLTNKGDGPDVFALTHHSSQGWVVTYDAPVAVGYGATATVVVSVTVPSDAISGTVDTTTITATSQFSTAVSAGVVDTTTVNRVYGVELAPNRSQAAAPDTVVVYVHTLTNTGSYTDTFTLASGSSQGWSVGLSPVGPIALAAWQTRTVVVSITVPFGSGGLTDVTVVTATRQGIPALQAAVTDTTTVGQVLGVALEPDHMTNTDPDVVIAYTHTLTNAGNGTDVFDITVASSQGWTVILLQPSSPITLTAEQTATVVVSLTVPAGTWGLTDVTVVTATSRTDTDIFDTAADTTIVGMTPGVELEPDRAGNADSGTAIIYTHTLTNAGDGPDTFDLQAVSSLGWAVDVEPTSVYLAADEAYPVVVTVTVPAGAISGTVDTTVITATSQFSSAVSASVVDTTTVNRVYGVEFAPDRSQATGADTAVVYAHTLTNTGNYTDTFALNWNSSQGWSVTLSPVGPVTLASGQTASVVVTVTVPSGSGGLTDVTVVTATRQGVPALQDTVVDTTIVSLGPAVELEPDHTGSADPGTVVTYTHTLTNTGDGLDTFDLTYHSSQGWSVVLSPPGPITLASEQTRTVQLILTVPPGAGGLTDVTVVTATSQIDTDLFDTATDTTTVSMTPGVELEPDRVGTAYTDTLAIYAHTLTNVGDGPDTFAFTYHSSQGWTVIVNPSNVTLSAGEERVVAVSIAVPASAISGTVDTTVITATSQADGGVSASVTDTTTVVARSGWRVFLPLVLRNYVPPSDGPDLIVTGISVEPASPAAGQPTTVYVTVRNQGNMPVQPGNNFYVDFYVDREPALFSPGDIGWGVQDEWFGVGDTVVLTGVYTFTTSGTHSLYAQADTDDAVVERYENNNEFGPVVLGVTGTGAVEVPVAPDLTPEDGRPRPTPTPGP